jgi:hypothetical protein
MGECPARTLPALWLGYRSSLVTSMSIRKIFRSQLINTGMKKSLKSLGGAPRRVMSDRKLFLRAIAAACILAAMVIYALTCRGT